MKYIFSITIGVIFITSFAFGSTGMGHAFEALAWFLWLTIIIPIILLIIWIITRFWPNKHTPTSWFLISSFDAIFIIYSSFALSAWSSGFGTTMGFGGALSAIILTLFGKQNESWLIGWKVALLAVALLVIIFGINKILYGLTRPLRIISHFIFSLTLISVILILHEPSISGPFVRWFVKPSALFLNSADPEIARGERLSDYYGFDQELKDYYHFEENLLRTHRFYQQNHDFYERFSKRIRNSTDMPESTVDAEKYLVLQAIANYKNITNKPNIKPDLSTMSDPGFLRDVHFIVDHHDISHSALYMDRDSVSVVKVQITQHTDGDSDKWLAHELECVMSNCPKYADKPSGKKPDLVTTIKNNAIFRADDDFRSKHSTYAWTHDNIVVTVDWSHGEKVNLQPFSILEAYLDKFPSTIKLSYEDYIQEDFWNKWNLEEMRRQLWLSNKWLSQLQSNDPEYDMILKNTLFHAFTFLNSRETVYKEMALADKQHIWKLYKGRDVSQIKSILSQFDTRLALATYNR